MTVESALDRAAFLADFGQDVTYSRPGGTASTIRAQFDSAAGDSSGFEQSGAVVQARPQLVVRSADLPAGAGQGDRVSLVHPVTGATTAYRVVMAYPDGSGMTRLDLELAQ